MSILFTVITRFETKRAGFVTLTCRKAHDATLEGLMNGAPARRRRCFVLVTLTVCLSQKSAGGNIISARAFQTLGDGFFSQLAAARSFFVLMKQTSAQLEWREESVGPLKRPLRPRVLAG